MDVGVWMSPEVLSHKLEYRDQPNPEATWNVKQVPKGLGRPHEIDRLFVASQNAWQGYFVLSKTALWSPEDEAAPWTLLFDTRTWTTIEPKAVKRFRGIRKLLRWELNLD